MMKEALVSKVVERAGGRLVDVGKRLGKAGGVARDVLNDNMRSVKRGVQRSVRKVEDVADEAALYIRRYPFRTVGVALGSGVLLGVLVGRRLMKK